MKILFIGSNPAKKAYTDDAFTLDTASGRNLQTWTAGIPGRFFYDNVLLRKTEDNRPLIRSEAAEAQASLAERIRKVDPDRIVALGKCAASALDKMRLNFLAMPHPSGLNRALNDKDYVADKIAELRMWCDGYAD